MEWNFSKRLISAFSKAFIIGYYVVESGRRMGVGAAVDAIAKQFWNKIQHSGPTQEEQPCPCLVGLMTHDLIDCFPQKTGDLIYSQQFSFLTILWPPLPCKSSKKEGKGSTCHFHISPIYHQIVSLSTQQGILESERSVLWALSKWLK